jgi:hypothetical protein
MMSSETHCPGLYCPHPPLSKPTGAEITTCPLEYVHPCLWKLHLEMMMKHIVLACTVPTTPFPANRGRDYYLPPSSCPFLFVEAAFGNDDEMHPNTSQQEQKLLPATP